MTRKLIVMTAFGLFAAWAQPASADCKSDLAALKAQVAREKEKSVARAAQKHVDRAEAETKGSESECRNEVTRGWRAMAAARQDLAEQAKEAEAKKAR